MPTPTGFSPKIEKMRNFTSSAKTDQTFPTFPLDRLASLRNPPCSTDHVGFFFFRLFPDQKIKRLILHGVGTPNKPQSAALSLELRNTATEFP